MGITLKRIALFSTLLGFFICYYSSPYLTSDTLWSAMIGKWIIAHHSVPLVDYWTWTYYGKPWTAEEWLFDFLLAIVAKGGYQAVVLMMTAVSLTTWLLLANTLKFKQVAYPNTWTLLMAALALSWDQIRAETFSYLFIAFVFWVIVRDRQNPTKWLFCLIPLEIVWVNFHGSFIMGLLFVGWEFVADLFTQRKRIKRLAITLIGMFAGTLVNPHGPKMYEFVLWLSLKTNISKYIAEWQSPTVHENFGLAIFTVFGLAVIYCFRWAKNGEKVSVKDTVLLILLLYMFMKANRFAPYLLLWLPIWAANKLSFNQPKFVSWFKNEFVKWRPVIYSGLSIGLLGLSIVAVSKIHGSLEANAASVLEPKSLAVVEKLHNEHPNWKIWNSYNIGGTLEFSNIPASIDGRTDLYLANGGMQTYTNIINVQPNGVSEFNSYHANIVYIEKDSALAQMLQIEPQWRMVYTDSYYDVFTRVGVQT
ncbi:hypothetical protein [Alicyclobacillus fodiniaquatilis]|uniref:Dolichyl-phosphate-mannose-protein mannosyltransferase n=1 Tax=Alicyclobacillus fodiniaquatilis TaxID=1661150 RepID=A0ABW4JJW6_9BACL